MNTKVFVDKKEKDICEEIDRAFRDMDRPPTRSVLFDGEHQIARKEVYRAYKKYWSKTEKKP